MKGVPVSTIAKMYGLQENIMEPRKRECEAKAHTGSRLGLLACFIAISILSSCKFIPTVIHHDPALAYEGLTAYHPYLDDIFHIVDMEGNIVLEMQGVEVNLDFEILETGDILVLGYDSIHLRSLNKTILWSISAPSCHHSVVQMPGGHIMYLFTYEMSVEGWEKPFLVDGIREVDPLSSETVWEWRAGDYLSTDDYCPTHILTMEPHDWTHFNTVVYREEEQAVYVNSRHLDRLIKIDHPSGEILWSMGRGGDFGEGLFSHSHDPQLLENGNIVMYDNGNHKEPIEYSRAIEIAYDAVQGWAEVVWEWPNSPMFFDPTMGDANRLPNGNTLITSSWHGRIYEVTPSCEIAWEMYLKPEYEIGEQSIYLYKSERFLF